MELRGANEWNNYGELAELGLYIKPKLCYEISYPGSGRSDGQA